MGCFGKMQELHLITACCGNEMENIRPVDLPVQLRVSEQCHGVRFPRHGIVLKPGSGVYGGVGNQNGWLLFIFQSQTSYCISYPH